MTRREALGLMLRTTAGLSLAGSFGCTSTEAAARFIKLRRGTGVFVDAGRRGGAIGWVATAKSAVIVDTQSQDGIRGFLSAFQRHSLSRAPLETVINTHHHRDHVGGNAILRPVVREIVAHANVPGYLTQMSERGIVPPDAFPDRTFSKEWRVDLDGETVLARHYGPAHTGGDVTVTFEKADVVHVGDLVYNRFHPHVDVGHGGNLQGWIDVLNQIITQYGTETKFICSHAKPDYSVVVDRNALAQQQRYLQTIIEHVRAAQKEGRSREETSSLSTLPGFEDYVPITDRHTLGRVIGAAWDELRQE